MIANVAYFPHPLSPISSRPGNQMNVDAIDALKVQSRLGPLYVGTSSAPESASHFRFEAESRPSTTVLTLIRG